MVDRSWLGLAIRVVGLLITGTSISHVAEAWMGAARWIQYASQNGVSTTEVTSVVIYAVATSLQLALGMLLFFNGGWLARRWLRGIDGRCPACMYDISNLQSDECPECGGPIRRITNTPAANRSDTTQAR